MEYFKCSATGKKTKFAYIVDQPKVNLVFSEEKYLLEHLKTIFWINCNGVQSINIKNDDELLDFFYNEEYYYYTEL